jgi:hypothetical protein
MGPRSTLKLLAIAAALTAYWIAFERESAGPEANAGRVFPDLEVDDIVELEIARASRPREASLGIDSRPIKLRQERSPSAWWIVEPIRFEALYPRAQAIAHALAGAVRIAEAPAGSSAFSGGADVVVRFTTRRGDERVLEIGAEHPAADLDFSYARLGGEVFVTRKDFRKTFLVTLTEMRSRTLIPVAPADAIGLSVEGDAAFAKRVERDPAAGTWRLREPVDALADRELTEALLLELNGWTVTDFLKDDALRPEDLAPYGLATPRAVISVRARGGRTVTVHAGADHGADGVHVRLAGEPHVFAAPRGPLEEAMRPPEALRSRFLLDLGLDEIEEVRVEGAGGDLVLARLEVAPRPADREPGPAHAWRVSGSLAGETIPGDRELIDGLVGTLRRTLILKFIGGGVAPAAIGLDPPLWRVLLRTAGGRRLELRIGTPSDAPEDAGLDIHHVAVPGEPGAFQVKTELPALLAAGPGAFRDRRVSRLDPASVRAIKVVSAGGSWELARTGPGEPWMLRVGATSPIAEVRELESARVDQLLGLLGETFRAIRFLPGIASYAEQGIELESPRRAIAIERIEGPAQGVFRKIVFGDAAEGSPEPEVLARMDLPGLPPFTVPRDLSRLFDGLVEHLRAVTGG